MASEHEPPRTGTGPAESGRGAVPGLVRLAATAWWHTTEWTVGTTVRATGRVARVAIHPDTAGELVQDVTRGVRTAARDLIGMTDLETQLRSATAPTADAARKVADAVPGANVARKVVDAVGASAQGRRSGATRNGVVAPSLRLKGEELLYKSRDVNYVEDAHPAYERLVESLAPDEARILRLLLLSGPQPAVDVRTGGPLGLITSRLLAPGLNMIGPRAGLRYVDRVPSYLTNLNRLGLVWFSRETLRDPERYQVLEAQPAVLESVHSVRQAKIVRRSIHLTPFGEGFCRAALVPETQRLAPLPEHASPAKRREPQAPVPND
ncbi:Abi-alpha family protein [Actinospica sp.]|jgi:hypothetical protein|uniref:Abi-alpha family protein n=1 Tax=Actinospica sp. TaxID=1872142 RepID=UPI002C43F999|nr:Abi-alpha family protein [Actinospica sp.]HWG27148.1 Abi-alpha family protein [Actinospica sp.]